MITAKDQIVIMAGWLLGYPSGGPCLSVCLSVCVASVCLFDRCLPVGVCLHVGRFVWLSVEPSVPWMSVSVCGTVFDTSTRLSVGLSSRLFSIPFQCSVHSVYFDLSLGCTVMCV